MTKPDGLPPESWDQLEAHQPPVPLSRLALYFLAVVAVVGAANVLLSHPFIWRTLNRRDAAQYVQDDPIATHMPRNLSAPPRVAGGVAIIGPSAVYYGVPPERGDEMLGEPTWSLTLPGCNPPTFLALAPTIARAQPRVCLIVLTVQSAGTTSNAPGAAETRAAYISPVNPAWGWRRELDGTGWREWPGTMPLVRYRAPLRRLVGEYVKAKGSGRRPEVAEWRLADTRREWPTVRDALDRYTEVRTLDAYLEYRMAQGGVNPEVRDLVAKMRRVEIDVEGTSANLRALTRMTGYLRGRDIRVAWVLFPENPVYGRLNAQDGRPIAPAEARPLAQQSFARLAEAERVPFVDLLDLVPPEDFIDLFHVAEPGRQKLIPHLRQAVEQAS